MFVIMYVTFRRPLARAGLSDVYYINKYNYDTYYALRTRRRFRGPRRQETTSFCHSGRRQYDASGGGTATTFPVEEKKEQR